MAPEKDAWIKGDSVIAIEKSEAHFTQVIKEEPTAVAYHHRGIARQALGFHELAIKDLDEAVRLGLKSPAIFINRANVWHSLGNDRNALADVNQAIDAAPENALAHNNRGLIWASLKDYDKALADQNRAVKLDPTNAEFFNNRGVTKVKLGQLSAALKDYTQAIAINESFAEAYANRGFASKKLGKYREALADYRQAVKLAPQSPQAFNDAAWLVATCPDQTLHDGERAVEYALYACELTAYKNADYVDTLAAAFARAGRFDDAVRTQQQAMTMMSNIERESARQRLRIYRSRMPYVDRQ